jgi:hypothetical protein
MNQEAKKLVVVGALAVVLLAVGAFQFLGKGGGGNAPAATPQAETAADPQAAEGESNETEAGETPKTAVTGSPTASGHEKQAPAQTGAAQPSLFAMAPLPVRDPFRPGEVQLREPEPPPALPPAAPTARRQTPNAPFDLGATPLNPMITGSLPAVGGALPMGATAPEPQEPVLRLRGVVSGTTPMAVLEDGNGRQRLVEVGGYLDAESRITSIQGETVTIVRRGQRKSLTIQEGTVGSK